MIKPSFLTLLTLVITVFLTTACKEKDNHAQTLEKFVKEMNVASGRQLANGNSLIGCEYTAGDTLFTYKIRVSDNRLEKVPEDSLKKELMKDITSERMRKIVNLVNRCNTGIEYVYQFQCKSGEEQVRRVIFTHNELKELTPNK